jgi:hypothetical protein
MPFDHSGAIINLALTILKKNRFKSGFISQSIYNLKLRLFKLYPQNIYVMIALVNKISRSKLV